jgi:hypothetical protein
MINGLLPTFGYKRAPLRKSRGHRAWQGGPAATLLDGGGRRTMRRVNEFIKPFVLSLVEGRTQYWNFVARSWFDKLTTNGKYLKPNFNFRR